MIMFGQTIWHEYGINLRQRKTISGLALLIYQCSYLKIISVNYLWLEEVSKNTLEVLIMVEM